MDSSDPFFPSLQGDVSGSTTLVPIHDWAHTTVPTHARSQTLLYPNTFMPRHIRAKARLCPDMIMPRHIYVQTSLCPDTLVSRHDCDHTIKPIHDCAYTFCAQTRLCPDTFLLCPDMIVLNT